MTTTMRWLLGGIVVVIAIVVTAFRADTTPANDPDEEKRLQGTWHVVAIATGGKTMPAGEVRELALRYVFDGNKLTIHRPEQPAATDTFTLDVASNPKRMTINHFPPFHTVYELEGNQLQLCLMLDKNPRTGFPKSLESKAVPTTDLYTLERR